jgi:hypothetical protein
VLAAVAARTWDPSLALLADGYRTALDGARRHAEPRRAA